ncbi:MAG TPA: carboxylating nicotinate-nucleotide diphosphorylase [Bacillota bacterium]|nr:carboxylating nicotinate-nucleotide diphosphorylase [Bacillota bacterium]HPP85473.1 carboxylating nicotinate-nucleotide diphosphorylase [Bacillota bacterium]
MKTIFDRIIQMSLEEDAPFGDITTNSIVPADRRVSGRFIAKDDGVLCGIDIAQRTFELVGGDFEMVKYFKDGDSIKKGDVIAEISGNARTILTGERTALNLMQRASGIATATAKAVKAVAGTKAHIADTRKTMPGLRLLDKYAVRVGGGVNHRFNLSDGVLIKDNHIAAAGSIKNAVEAARRHCPHTLKIEVEVENFVQLYEALEAKADIIMLDNMSNEDMAKAVQIIGGRAIVEASGNMGEKDLSEVAKTGVDLISIGSLTHSVKSLDISLKFSII